MLVHRPTTTLLRRGTVRAVPAAAATTPRRTSRMDAAAWLLLLVVAAPPMVSSAFNLYALGQDQLALEGHTALLVPLSVDAAGLLCVVLTLRAVAAGRTAGAARLGVLAFASFSAWLGWQEARSIGTTAAQVFYPAMPAAATLLLDQVIRHRMRDTADAAGATEAPLPRFRAVRWLVAPRETRRAWSAAVRCGITEPAAALELVRERAHLRTLDAAAQLAAARHALGGATDVEVRRWLYDRGVTTPVTAAPAAPAPAQRRAAPPAPDAAAPPAAAPSPRPARAPRRDRPARPSRAAAAKLHAEHPDMSAREIARRVGADDRTIRRWLTAAAPIEQEAAAS